MIIIIFFSSTTPIKKKSNKIPLKEAHNIDFVENDTNKKTFIFFNLSCEILN